MEFLAAGFVGLFAGLACFPIGLLAFCDSNPICSLRLSALSGSGANSVRRAISV
jgi:hypothetical protein